LASSEGEQGAVIASLAGREWPDSATVEEADTHVLTDVGWQIVADAIELMALEVAPPGVGTAYRQAAEIKGDARNLNDNWDLIDRSTAEHMAIQNGIAATLEAYGLQPLSPSVGDPQFDLAAVVANRLLLVEVKSANDENKVQQARLGIGQVLEYRGELRARVRQPIEAVVVLGAPPLARSASAGREASVTVVGVSQFEQAVLIRHFGVARLH
jgi:hypothetical protein